MKRDLLKALEYRILSYTFEANQILNGKMPIPRVAILHPTYKCNHNCIGCDFGEENKQGKVLTKDELEHITDELIDIGVKGVEFSGGGEPLIDEEVKDIIIKLNNKEISTGVLTNGSFFSGEMQKTIIKNCSYIRVSLEAGSNDIFKRAKGITNDEEFPKIIGNIEKGLQLRESYGSEIDIGIKFTVGRHNYSDMENAILLARNLGVDSIQFKLYENVDSIQLYKNPEKLIKDEKGVRIKFKDLKEKYTNSTTKIIGNLQKSKLEGKCWLSPLITVVDANGYVFLCSYYRHRQDSHKIGNIFENSFKEIWFSDRHREVIERINLDECNKYDCRFHRYNTLMAKVFDKKRDFLNFL